MLRSLLVLIGISSLGSVAGAANLWVESDYHSYAVGDVVLLRATGEVQTWDPELDEPCETGESARQAYATLVYDSGLLDAGPHAPFQYPHHTCQNAQPWLTGTLWQGTGFATVLDQVFGGRYPVNTLPPGRTVGWASLVATNVGVATVDFDTDEQSSRALDYFDVGDYAHGTSIEIMDSTPPGDLLIAATSHHLLEVNARDPSDTRVIGPLGLGGGFIPVEMAYHPGVARMFGIVRDTGATPGSYFAEFDLVGGAATLLKDLGPSSSAVYDTLAYRPLDGTLVTSRSASGCCDSSEFYTIATDGTVGTHLASTGSDNDTATYDTRTNTLYVLDRHDYGYLAEIDLVTGTVTDRGLTGDLRSPAYSQRHDKIFAIRGTNGVELVSLWVSERGTVPGNVGKNLGSIPVPSDIVRALAARPLPEASAPLGFAVGAVLLHGLASRKASRRS